MFSFPGEIRDPEILQELASLQASVKEVRRHLILRTEMAHRSVVIDIRSRQDTTMEKLSGRSGRQGEARRNLIVLTALLQIKAESIILSSFQEVLYLDSDNIPLRDPSYLFDTELYAGEGQPRVVLWPDLNKDHRQSTPAPNQKPVP